MSCVAAGPCYPPRVLGTHAAVATSDEKGQLLATNQCSLFIRGVGSFSGGGTAPKGAIKVCGPRLWVLQTP